LINIYIYKHWSTNNNLLILGVKKSKYLEPFLLYFMDIFLCLLKDLKMYIALIFVSLNEI